MFRKKEKVLKRYKTGGLLSRRTFVLTEVNLKCKGNFAGSFSVPRADIDTAIVETKSVFKLSVLKVVGRGTTLAEMKMPRRRAEKAQAWILENAKITD